MVTTLGPASASGTASGSLLKIGLCSTRRSWHRTSVYALYAAVTDTAATPGGARMHGNLAESGREYELKLDTTVPHSARIWNYWLGGKDNFAADRAAGDHVRATYPEVVDVALVSRAFLVRVVTYLAGEAGVRQFLDIGTGLPTANNTHEVAQRIVPDARVVYVDNDPLVLVHARALLTSSPEGATDYLDADVRDPDSIVGEARRKLDFTQPIAVMLLGVLGNVADTGEVQSIVKRLVDALPSGSYLVINDGTKTSDVHAEAEQATHEAGHQYVLRTPEQVASFFEGLQLIAPGVVRTPTWRPDPGTPVTSAELPVFCGVARKP
jgi:hypothetical protein